MVLLILATGLVPLGLFHVTRVFRAVPLSGLHNYVGQSRKVEFTVSRTFVRPKGTYLYALEDDGFYVILAKTGNFVKNPELFYPGKPVRITAKVEQEDEQYYMMLTSRDQISIRTP